MVADKVTLIMVPTIQIPPSLVHRRKPHYKFTCGFEGGAQVDDFIEVYQLSLYISFLLKAIRNLKIRQDVCILKTER